MPRSTLASSAARLHRRILALLCAVLALPAAARAPGDLDALAASRRLDVTLKARVQGSGLVRSGSEAQLHERLGVPTFVWASKGGSEAGLKALQASRAAASLKAGAAPAALPEDAARAHLATYASLYGLGPADLATVEVGHVHDLGRGAVVVQLQQRLDGLEVFREQLRVVMGRDQSLTALSGFLAPGSAAAAAAPVAVPPTQAVALAFSDLSGQAVGGGSFVSLGAAPGGYEGVDLAPTFKGMTGAITQPARVKPVWFHLPEGLVRAYYLEVDSATAQGTDYYAYVISAADGSILFRHDLTQSDAAHTYGYRVYASPLSDPRNPGHPTDGPEGNLFDPHPTGVLDGTQPPGAVPQVDLSIQSSVYLSDPWLPAGAVGTTGNNVDAFSDLTTPDGFTANSLDARADLTGPGTFARTYDPAAPNAVNQLRGAVTQMFYNVNFFHDWYYVSGFTEAAGNAQTSNYGRGGLQGDSINAEGQDFAGRNNANMSTPADGARPRMRMYLFDGIAARHLFMTGTAAADYSTGVPAGWGIASHDVTGPVVRVTDGVGGATYPPATTTTASVYDGCDYTAPAGGGVDPNWAAVTGKVAFIDRGGAFVPPALACGFQEKAINAQKAGAIAVLIASTTTHAAPTAINMGASTVTPTAVTIPVYQLGTPDGDAVRTALAAGPVTAHLVRDPAVDHDGTVDNQIMAHEWGHYISNRLVQNSAGLTTNMSGGMGEGWADFHAMLLTVKEEDAQVPSNASYDGVYGLAVWTQTGGTNGPSPNQGAYFGIRRMPYSTDFARNNMTYQNIQDSSAVPVGVPFAFWPAPNTTSVNGGNSEVHNTGEVWATMLWECYAGILRDTLGASPRLTFTQARDRMKDYLVAGYKATPGQPTFLEARDALLAAIFAGGDARDYQVCLAGFAKRGAGVGAASPDRYSTTNNGVVESFTTGAQLTFTGATLTDDVTACDRDGILDTGETGTVRISLRNDSAQSLTGTTAQVALTGAAAASFTLPAGTVVTFPASLPGETVVGTLQVAMAPGLPALTQLDLQIAPADPAVPAQAAVTWSRRTNYDDVAGQSATDDAETGQAPLFTASTLGNVTPLSPWFKVENGPADHAYKVLDQNGVTDLALVSPGLAVGVGPFSLSFRHRYSLEFSGATLFDGAVVELSADNGNTWTDIGSLATGQAYTGALAGGSPLGTRRAFAAANPGYPAYVTSTINLGTTYAGQTVRVRFRLATDANGRADGWEVDDVAFTGLVTFPFAALLPNTCSAGQGNRRPVATIGAIAAQPERSTVTLTGAATDADLNPVTLQWSQLSGPPVTLTPGPGTVSFTAPDVPAAGGSVVIVLTALDGVARSAAVSRTVPITNVDRAPTASAGSALAVDEKTLVQLEGAATDPDGDALTVAWTQTAGPAASLSSTTDLRPVFLAPEVPAAGATLTFQLAATAGGATTTATVDVQVRNVNHPPGVSAGPRQVVTERSAVQLDGQGLDADGDTLTYAWTQVSPATPAVTLSDATAPRPTFSAPEVAADTDFVFQLAVGDGIAASPTTATVTVRVLNVNRKPVAVAAAGAPEVASRGQGALDGRGSTDPDGDPLSYRWVQRAGPAVTLSDPTSAQPTFTAPTVSADTALTFSLEVTDGSLLSDPATVTVTVKRLNRKPLALAWGPTTAAERSAGVLDGLGSSDPDGDPLTYRWTQVSPATPAALDSATSATPTFTAPEVSADTAFVFQLVVNDGADDSDPVQVTVNVQQVNRPPVAITGADLTAAAGDTVTLDASGSTDPDGDVRAYAWTQLSGPGVTLSSSTAAKPTFTAPSVSAQTVLGFKVTVSDGQGGSAESRMYVTVTPTGSGCSAGTGPLLPGGALLLGLLGLARRRRR